MMTNANDRQHRTILQGIAHRGDVAGEDWLQISRARHLPNSTAIPWTGHTNSRLDARSPEPPMVLHRQ